MENSYSNLPAGKPNKPLTFADIQKISNWISSESPDNHAQQMKDDPLVTVVSNKGIETLHYRKAFMRHGYLYSLPVDARRIRNSLIKWIRTNPEKEFSHSRKRRLLPLSSF